MADKCKDCINFSLFAIGDRPEATCLIHGGKIGVHDDVGSCSAYVPTSFKEDKDDNT